MYDLGVFFGFIGFVLLPCAITLFTRSHREEENVIPSRSQYASSRTKSKAVFIAPVRRDTAFLTVRAE